MCFVAPIYNRSQVRRGLNILHKSLSTTSSPPKSLLPKSLLPNTYNTRLVDQASMSKSIVNTTVYPFQFEDPVTFHSKPGSSGNNVTLTLPNVRGSIPSIQASRLRSMMLEAHNNPEKILAHCCSYDGLSSRLVEEAGFPMVFLAGYPCASAYG